MTVSKLTLITVLAVSVFLEGTAQFCLVSARVDVPGVLGLLLLHDFLGVYSDWLRNASV